MATYAELAAAALGEGRTGLAAELRGRVPAGTSTETLHYLMFTLLFAGQLTTEATAGFVLAHLLGGARDGTPAEDLVHDVLHRHPPAPLSLWRFATEEIVLGGVTLPAGSPVLVGGLPRRPSRRPVRRPAAGAARRAHGGPSHGAAGLPGGVLGSV
jgi:cytochrome P450